MKKQLLKGEEYILFVPEELVDDRINFKKSEEGQSRAEQR